MHAPSIKDITQVNYGKNKKAKLLIDTCDNNVVGRLDMAFLFV